MVRGKLSDLSYHVLSIRESRAKASLHDMLNGMQKVKLHDLVVFSRQFATMIDAGLSVVKCLDILQKQSPQPAPARKSSGRSSTTWPAAPA